MHHQWQDIVLSASILGFNLALIPTLLSKKHHPHAGTGIVTAAFQLVNCGVFISLGLWYSATMAVVNASLWSIIVIQSLNAFKPSKRRR
jgi:hypothetical protein